MMPASAARLLRSPRAHRGASTLAALAVLMLAGCDADPGPSAGSSSSAAPSASPSSGATASGPQATTSAAPQVTAPVPPPTPGSVDETASVTAMQTQPPVALDDESELGGGVSVSISKIEKLQVEAKGPGEIAGPGIRLTVAVSNDSSGPLDAGGVAVDLRDAAGVPATPIFSSGDDPLKGELAAGATGSGEYLFTIPPEQRDPVTVYVTVAGGTPVAAFQGKVS